MKWGGGQGRGDGEEEIYHIYIIYGLEKKKKESVWKVKKTVISIREE